MMVLGLVCVALMLFYAGYLLRCAWYFGRIGSSEEEVEEWPSVVVVVPARDEEGKVGKCVANLVGQDYPAGKMEIVVVNDHSGDGTVAEARAAGQGHPGFKVVDLEAVQGTAYKKAAVKRGIEVSEGEWVLTTDADCRMGPDWLRTMAGQFRENVGMVSGPVELTGKGMFQEMQALEFMGLVAVGAGSIAAGAPNMCNGANLAYRRAAFEQVGGFSGIDHIASGDDELLMHKIAAETDWEVVFAKERKAVVKTEALATWSAFRAQRKRWVSKSRAYKRKGITAILVLSYLAILGIPLLLTLAFFHPTLWYFFAASLSLKVLSEGIILSRAATFFARFGLLKWLLPEQLAHIAYVLWVGLAGNARSYNWKGRTVK